MTIISRFLIFVTFFLLISAKIEPFKIQVEERALEDLKYRLNNVRWPNQIEGAEWDYGTNYEFMKDLVEYWKDKYDWRKEEEKLNRFPQFKTEINGTNIHFIHSKSTSKNATGIVYPLLFVHGWPGSFIECTKLIPLLNREENGISFDVVCPSLPGYGFSDQPVDRGFGAKKMAKVFAELMSLLGYQKYIAQGGDWGSHIATLVAHFDPKHCTGIHVHLFQYAPSQKGIIANARYALEMLSKWWGGENYDMHWNSIWWVLKDGGYLHHQATKPDSLAVGLNDSPVGLASYIIEKYHAWSHLKNGKLEDTFTKDELITFINVYWFSQSIGSSMRLYFEEFGTWDEAKIQFMKDLYVEQPTGFVQFKEEINKTPRWIMELYYNVVHLSRPERGGHFGALEEPGILNEDIRKYFETSHSKQSQIKTEL